MARFLKVLFWIRGSKSDAISFIDMLGRKGKLEKEVSPPERIQLSSVGIIHMTVTTNIYDCNV